MFTVLHRDDRDFETLYNANHVQFIPMTEENGRTGGVHMLCGPTEAAHGVHVGTIRHGNVFVMNEQGATVARYWVGKREDVPDAPPDSQSATLDDISVPPPPQVEA